MVEQARKALPGLLRKSWHSINKKKSEEYLLRKRRQSLRLTLFIAIGFVMLCFYALIAPHVMPHGVIKKQVSTTSSVQNAISGYDGLINKADKISTLQSSVRAALTAYPNKETNTLSSSSVDERTKNQVYVHSAGKGGVNGQAKAADTPATFSGNGCSPQSDGTGSYGTPSIGDYSFYVGCDAKIGPDFLIGNVNNVWSGVLFNLDSDLTLQNNPIVTNLTNLMQLIALALVTPLILLMGTQMMIGGIITRYAGALEALPRLILAMIGASLSIVLAEGFLQIVDELILQVVNIGANSGVQITSVVYPASSWGDWMLGLVTLVVTLTIVLPIVAQIEFFGTSAGAWFALPTAILMIGLFWGNMHYYVETVLSMILGAQIFIRILLIDFYVIMSPLAMIAAGLPGRSGVGFTKEWLLGFAGLAASQLAQVAVLVIGLAVMAAYAKASNPGNGVLSNPGSDIVSRLMDMGTMLLMLRVPSIFKTNATGLITQVGSAVGGTLVGSYTQGFM